MMTQDEIAALVQLLDRAPMSRAEALWVNAVLARELDRARERERATTEEQEDE